MQVLKLNNLIINHFLYSWLKGICFHRGILVFISIGCLITPLDRDKWQYISFCVGIKNRLEMFE